MKDGVNDQLCFYRTLFHETADAIILLDESGIVIEANDNTCSFLGVGRESIIGRKIYEFEADILHEMTLGVIHEIKEKGILTYETSHVISDEEIVPIEVQAKIIELCNKPAVLVILRDIAQRPCILGKALKKSEGKYRSILENLADGYCELDNSGKITFFNSSMVTLLGYSREELLGKSFFSLMDDETAYGIRQALTQISLSKQPVRATLRKKDGAMINIEYSISPIKKSNGESSGFGGTIRDITEQMSSELQLKKIHDELEKSNFEVISMFTELKSTQSKMLQSEKMASIGQLAAGVAHEINNPTGFITSNLGSLDKYFSKIMTYVDGLEKALSEAGNSGLFDECGKIKEKLKIEYITQDISDLIKESLDGANRIKKIVQNLKSFSRLDEEEMQDADMNECLETTLNIVWNELKYKAEVKKEYGDIPAIKCYPQELNQVFMNILINAVQAIKERGEIKIRTFMQDSLIKISISDTGIGIPKGNLGRLFEPFFTTKEVGKGTGLGLSICYDIVKKHKGEITVESEEGKGTTFTVCLPVLEGEAV